jgi:hypothetical protein
MRLYETYSYNTCGNEVEVQSKIVKKPIVIRKLL